MKFLVAFSLLCMMVSAEASYYQESCSNAEGTVRFSEGHNEMGVFLKTQTISGQWVSEGFRHDQVNITVSKRVSLGEKKDGGEGWFSEQRWWSANVVITPKAEVEARFKEFYPSGKLKDYFVCTKVVSGETVVSK